MVFGTENSDRTMVILLHEHFSFWLNTFCNAMSIITNCAYVNVSEYNIMAYVKNSFTFFTLVYYV